MVKQAGEHSPKKPMSLLEAAVSELIDKESFAELMDAVGKTGVMLIDEAVDQEFFNYTQFAQHIAKKYAHEYKDKIEGDFLSETDLFVVTKAGIFTWIPWLVSKRQGDGREDKPLYVVPKDIFVSYVNKVDQMKTVSSTETDPLEEFSNEIKIFYNKMFKDAEATEVTDIHIDPYDQYYAIMVRRLGERTRYDTLTPDRGETLVKYITSLCELQSDVRHDQMRFPQDGRLSSPDGKIDLRINFLPVINGTKITIRLLKREPVRDTLESLGFLPDTVSIIQKFTRKTWGLVLVVGPTGSGKSRTLSTILTMMDQTKKNILTIEDPVEYRVKGVNQSQVFAPKSSDQKYTFADGVRAFLRADPDVCLVGEIRDRETARTAVDLSNTGHLVLSTLHTNSAASTPTRLLTGDIALDNTSLASSLLLVVAQRLVKRLCPHCKKEGPADRKKFDEFYFRDMKPFEPLFEKDVKLYFHNDDGCHECGGKKNQGYIGRMVVEELLIADDPEVRAIITNSSGDPEKVSKYVKTTFYSSLITKAMAGQIDIYQALEVIN